LEARPEWHEGELRHFEALQSERDANNRTAQDQPVHGKTNRQRNAADEQPEDICDKRRRTASVRHFFSERRKRQGREFEALPPDGDVDDRNAPQQSHHSPSQGFFHCFLQSSTPACPGGSPSQRGENKTHAPAVLLAGFKINCLAI